MKTKNIFSTLGLSALFAAAAFGAESSALELEGELKWTNSALSGGYEDRNGDWITVSEAWENASQADFATTGTLSLDVDNSAGNVSVAGLSVSGGNLVKISGDDLAILEGGTIAATGTGSSVSIYSTVAFENGGSLSGTVKTEGGGMIKVNAGTLTSANISGNGTLYIAEGARVEKTNIITTDYTQTVKLAGTGTYAVSTQKSSGFVGVMSFSGSETEDFKGTLEVDGYTGSNSAGKAGSVLLSSFSGVVKISGGLNLARSDFGNASKIVWTKSGWATLGSYSYLDREFEHDLEVASEVVLTIYGSYACKNLVWGGDVSGDGSIVFDVYGGNSYTHNNFTFASRVNLGTLSIDAGRITFRGASSQLTQFKGSTASLWSDSGAFDDFLTIASDATLTITGEANADRPHEGAFILGTQKEQTVNVDGVLNLQNDGMSNIDGNGVVNVSGEMNFNTGLFVNDNNGDDNAVVLNVNDGARINVGGVGIDSAGTLALNLDGNVTIGSLAEEWNINRDLKINGTLTVDTEKRDLNFDGAATGTGTESWVSAEGTIYGDGALVKKGAGTLKLNWDNTYTGGTTVEEGTLRFARVKAMGSGGLTVKSGAEAVLSVGVNDRGGRFEFNADNQLAIDAGGKVSVKGSLRNGIECISRAVISGTTVVSNGAMEINNYGVLELNGGGKLEVSGSLTNAGTLNIVVQADGVNSGVVISDGATFVNSGTIVMSAGSLAEGQSVTVFADVLGNGILDSTGTVQGTGTIKVFGGTYADGIFTAGTKSEVNAGEQLGGGNQGGGNGGHHGGHHVGRGESVEIKDKHHHDGHGKHHAVYLASQDDIYVHQVDNLDCGNIHYGGKDHEIGASWDFSIEKSDDVEVFVQMYIGKGLSLDDIIIFHKDDGDSAEWTDFTETVADLSYDSQTGLLSFTTKDFSSYAVTGTYSSVAIPEPSAFALLAGLGALAFVGTRRRNRRK